MNLHLPTSSASASNTKAWRIRACYWVALILLLISTVGIGYAQETVNPNAAPNDFVLAVGNNANPIPDGVIAKVTAVLAPDFTTSLISLLDPLAASPDGNFVPISASGGTITSALVSPDRRLRPPLTRIGGRCLTQ